LHQEIIEAEEQIDPALKQKILEDKAKMVLEDAKKRLD